MRLQLQPIIGLEIHVQLKTKSKMFCSCSNVSESQAPNTAICEVCTGQPGTLPVANKTAIEWATKTALALHCSVSPVSKFDRKNYFYPDLPKGYQISQYDKPIGVGGFLTAQNEGKKHTVRIRRLHLEEDAAKNFHSADGLSTFVDFNRAGTPLMEIVTEPDIQSPASAKKFLQELRLIMLYLDVSDADMEKGQLRCDANVSLLLDDKNFTTTPIVEIKNMNSFKAVERAVKYETQRQQREYDEKKLTSKTTGKTTRGWDDTRGVTEEQRWKEEAHDYRYFPEPDIPPINFNPKAKDGIDAQTLLDTMIELPQAKRERFEKECGVTKTDAQTLTSNKELANYFEQVVSELREWISTTTDMEGTEDEIWQKSCNRAVKIANNWLLNELLKLLNKDKITIDACAITPENFAEFVTMIYERKINSTIAQKLLKLMYSSGGDPSSLLEAHDLKGEAKGKDLEKIIGDIIASNPEPVANFRNGKTNAIMFLVGQVMKEAKGKANPRDVRKMLEKKLKN